MVLPDSMSQPGGGAWIDIKGKSTNKFVKEQADWVKAEIEKHLEKKPESRPMMKQLLFQLTWQRMRK